jgi:hypothetical protein
MPDPVDPAVGLCAACAHARRVTTPRSLFWLCERSRTDPNYARYPRLPMRECPGFEPGTPVEPGSGADEPRKK